jgi:hypothetical protein
LTLLALIFSAPGPVGAAYVADPLEVQKTSPEELLNAAGTLNLNSVFHGALDLDGWNVRIDPERGPIFAPALEPAPGQWANVGSGLNGSINGPVHAVAVSGTDVYVGGYFTNVSNNGPFLPAADYIVVYGLGGLPIATPTRTATPTHTTVTITETTAVTPTLTETVTETPSPTETMTETPTVTATPTP